MRYDWHVVRVAIGDAGRHVCADGFSFPILSKKILPPYFGSISLVMQSVIYSRLLSAMIRCQIHEYAKKKYENWIKTQAADELECPAPFTLDSPADITEANYLTFVKLYNVEGIAPPPPRYITVSVGLGKEQNNGIVLSHDEESTGKLQIPDGYELILSYPFSCRLSYIVDGSKTEDVAIIATIGTDLILAQRGSKGGKRLGWKFDGTGKKSPVEGPQTIPVSVIGRQIKAFTFSVELHCKRTIEEWRRWQIQTFDAIRQAYLDMKFAYDQKLAAQKEQADQRAGLAGVIAGLNPGLNRDIEKTELKKQCVRALMLNCLGQRYGSFDASPIKDETQDKFNDFDILDAIKEGNYIQFFEQAFEWENMTYVFYPYFWANKAQWDMKAMTYDDDPQFTKFLQAGAARVMLPARKNFEDVVLNYLKTGKIWDGGTAPVAEDPLFMSVADELKNQTDDSGGEADGEPWEVVVPTTQIYLQQDEVPLPVFEE